MKYIPILIFLIAIVYSILFFLGFVNNFGGLNLAIILVFYVPVIAGPLVFILILSYLTYLLYRDFLSLIIHHQQIYVRHWLEGLSILAFIIASLALGYYAVNEVIIKNPYFRSLM